MKNRFSKMALICLTAMAAAAFAIPTLVVSPSAMRVEPGVSFDIKVIYTNTNIMLFEMTATDTATLVGIVPIPDNTKNQPNENMVVFQDVIPEHSVHRRYVFAVADEDLNWVYEAVNCMTTAGTN